MVLLEESGLLKEWIRTAAMNSRFGSVIYEWNKKVQCFQVINRTALTNYAARLLLGVSYGVLIFVQVLKTWRKSSTMVLTHSILFINAYIQGLTSCFVNLRERKEVVALANNMINYEKREVGIYQSLRNKKGKDDTVSEKRKRCFKKYLIQLQTYSGILMPILYHLDILRNPCFPMYFGYWMSNQCQNTELGTSANVTWSLREIVIKVGISLMSYVNWSYIYTGYCYNLAVELLICGHCFWSYISEYGKNMMNVRKVDESAVTITLKFRKLQMLLVVYRDIYSRLMLATNIVCVTIIETLCIYNTISSIQEGTFTSSSMNFLYAWCSVLLSCNVILFFGTLSTVYQVSRKVNKSVKGKFELRENKWFKRWLKSCPILRIYFGGSNFLEEMTPLNIMNLVINLTVNLLLLK